MVNQNVPIYEGEAPSSKERRRIVDESGRDAIMFNMDSAEGSKIRIWDLVDESWTEPLERYLAMDHYLSKIVFKCSVCNETSLHEGDIQRHLTQVKTNSESHKEAELHQGIGEGGQIMIHCTGCGAPLSMRKNQGQRHIDRIKNDYETHIKAGSIDVLLMHKYATAPSVSMPTQVMETILFEGKEPDVDQENRNVDDSPRRRRRRRRRNR